MLTLIGPDRGVSFDEKVESEIALSSVRSCSSER